MLPAQALLTLGGGEGEGESNNKLTGGKENLLECYIYESTTQPLTSRALAMVEENGFPSPVS